SLSSVERATVRYIRARKPVWTEISPQSGCASLSSYKSMIHSLIHYVESRDSSGARNWWAGVMLDEEPNFGFSVSSVVSLNTYVSHQMINVPGSAFVFTEDATWAGAWSERQYNRIIANTVAAPQVYNSFMVGIVNRSRPLDGLNLVTWTKTAGFPFNRESYVTGRIHGAPYKNSFGTRNNWKWANQGQSRGGLPPAGDRAVRWQPVTAPPSPAPRPPGSRPGRCGSLEPVEQELVQAVRGVQRDPVARVLDHLKGCR